MSRLCNLTVDICEAQGLPKVGKLLSGDPYVIVYLSSRKEAFLSTKVAKNPQSPVWNHKFCFSSVDRAIDELTVIVKSKLLGNAEATIGRVKIPIAQLALGTKDIRFYPIVPALRVDNAGKIKIGLQMSRASAVDSKIQDESVQDLCTSIIMGLKCTCDHEKKGIAGHISPYGEHVVDDNYKGKSARPRELTAGVSVPGVAMKAGDDTTEGDHDGEDSVDTEMVNLFKSTCSCPSSFVYNVSPPVPAMPHHVHSHSHSRVRPPPIPEYVPPPEYEHYRSPSPLSSYRSPAGNNPYRQYLSQNLPSYDYSDSPYAQADRYPPYSYLPCSLPYSTLPYNSTPYNSTPYNSAPYNSTPYNSTPYRSPNEAFTRIDPYLLQSVQSYQYNDRSGQEYTSASSHHLQHGYHYGRPPQYASDYYSYSRY